MSERFSSGGDAGGMRIRAKSPAKNPAVGAIFARRGKRRDRTGPLFSGGAGAGESGGGVATGGIGTTLIVSTSFTTLSTVFASP
jgi:hypothetical protein